MNAVFFQRAIFPPTLGQCALLEGVIDHPEWGTVDRLYTRLVSSVYRQGNIFIAGDIVYIKLRKSERSCANENCLEE
ncbi:hypothetical protein [Xanthomonas phage L522]|nr:hypothetical protein [Xanthomonas phage L522]